MSVVRRTSSLRDYENSAHLWELWGARSSAGNSDIGLHRLSVPFTPSEEASNLDGHLNEALQGQGNLGRVGKIRARRQWTEPASREENDARTGIPGAVLAVSRMEARAQHRAGLLGHRKWRTLHTADRVTNRQHHQSHDGVALMQLWRGAVRDEFKQAEYYIKDHYDSVKDSIQIFAKDNLLYQPTDNSYKWAGGGFVSNAEDLVKLGSAVLASLQDGLGTIAEQPPALPEGPSLLLQPKTVETMWTPVVSMGMGDFLPSTTGVRLSEVQGWSTIMFSSKTTGEANKEELVDVPQKKATRGIGENQEPSSCKNSTTELFLAGQKLLLVYRPNVDAKASLPSLGEGKEEESEGMGMSMLVSWVFGNCTYVLSPQRLDAFCQAVLVGMETQELKHWYVTVSLNKQYAVDWIKQVKQILFLVCKRLATLKPGQPMDESSVTTCLNMILILTDYTLWKFTVRADQYIFFVLSENYDIYPCGLD
eukprot:Em0836g2a